MMNHRAFRSTAHMNLVYKSKDFGSELWLGDYYAATDYNLLKTKNIKAVLTAAAMLGVAYPKQLEITHKTINAFDIPSYKMAPHFQQAYQFIHEGLKKGNVLVHCAAGISRSTTCVLVYMMRIQGYMFNQALDIVRAKRGIVNPNYGFQAELKKYQAKLKKLAINSQHNNMKSQINQSQNQKKVVLKFLQQSEKSIEQQKPENGKKLNTTLNGRPMYSKFMRGKSLNMTQGHKLQFGNMLLSSKLPSHPQRSSLMSNNKYIDSNKGVLKIFQGQLNQIGTKLQSIKIQNPKIVTIKK